CLLKNAERGVLRHVLLGITCRGRRQGSPNPLYPTGGDGLDHSFVEYLSGGQRVFRKLLVVLAIFIAGSLLMLARSSPALAADTHGKSDNSKQGAATAQKNETPAAHNDQGIGGGDGKGTGNGKGKDNGQTSGAASKQDAAPAKGSDTSNSGATTQQKSSGG